MCKIQIVLLSFFLTPGLSFAQSLKDSLYIHVESKALIANRTAPHWLVYNQHGFWDVDKASDFYVRGEMGSFLLQKGEFSLSANVDMIGKADDFFFNELNLNARWKGFDLELGYNEVNMPDFPDELSSGHFYLSNNARTIPRATIGILQYEDVPLTKGYLQLRAGLSQGILDSGRPSGKVLYHEKYGYLRTQRLPINLSAGFAHNALFGGSLNGVKLSSKYWEVFTGSSSSDSEFNGDHLNAAGAHFGIFDYGASIETEELDLQVYYQQPRARSRVSGAKRFSDRNKDFLVGFLVKCKSIPWIDEILYENLYTVHQSGAGLPDIVVNGVGYDGNEFAGLDYDRFVWDNYGIVADGLTLDEFMEIVRRESNNGLDFGGREAYYTNVAYPFGNTFHGNVIGNSLLLTRNRMEGLVPGITLSDENLVVSNRVQAHHIGFRGAVFGFSYLAKITFAQHWGSYEGLYGGWRYSWELDRDYYFRDGIKMQSYYLRLAKDLEEIPLRFSLELAVDVRTRRLSIGSIMGVRYTLK